MDLAIGPITVLKIEILEFESIDGYFKEGNLKLTIMSINDQ